MARYLSGLQAGIRRISGSATSARRSLATSSDLRLSGVTESDLAPAEPSSRAAGVDLSRPPGLRGFLLQTHARDTWEVLKDLSVPVYVAGKRRATIRCAYTVAV